MKTMDKQDPAEVEPHIPHSRFTAAMGEVSEAENLDVLLEMSIDHLLLKYGSYHHIAISDVENYNRPSPYFARNLPIQITDYFDNIKVNDDPGVLEVFLKARYIWLSDLIHADSIFETPHQKRLERTLSVVGDALLIPLFGPFNRKGYLFVGFGKPKTYFDPVFAWQIQALAQTIHVRYSMLVQGFNKASRLTRRESEVLELVTFGKTNPEIGQVLGISSSTVRGYVKNIFIKLGTQDRVTAALLARHSSLIL